MGEGLNIIPVEEQRVGEAEHFDLPDLEIDVDALIEAEGIELQWIVDEADLAPDPEAEGDVEEVAS